MKRLKYSCGKIYVSDVSVLICSYWVLTSCQKTRISEASFQDLVDLCHEKLRYFWRQKLPHSAVLENLIQWAILQLFNCFKERSKIKNCTNPHLLLTYGWWICINRDNNSPLCLCIVTAKTNSNTNSWIYQVYLFIWYEVVTNAFCGTGLFLFNCI